MDAIKKAVVWVFKAIYWVGYSFFVLTMGLCAIALFIAVWVKVFLPIIFSLM